MTIYLRGVGAFCTYAVHNPPKAAVSGRATLLGCPEGVIG